MLKKIIGFVNSGRPFWLVYNFVLGIHPHNTIFSFNYQNVRHINEFLTKVRQEITGDESVLIDVGCGQSPYYSLFCDLISRYIAVDMPANLPSNEWRKIEQLPGLAEAIPLEDSVADIVLCNQVLEHVWEPLEAIRETYRILKPGGKFIGSVPHVSPVHLEPNDFRRYTDLGIKKILEDVGYIDILIEGNGGVYSAAALMISMDWMLSTRKENEPQQFSPRRALWLAPIVGLMNSTALLLDTLLGDKSRTPSNLCWRAIKPDNLQPIQSKRVD